MILGIQIIGVMFGLFLIYYTFLQYKKREFSKTELVVWILCWSVYIYVTLYPKSLEFLAKKLNLVRTMDLLTIVGFMFLIGMSFYNHTLVRRNRKKLEVAVRQIAIETAKKDTFLRILDKLINIPVSRFHKGVRHSRNRSVHKGLTSCCTIGFHIQSICGFKTVKELC